MTGSCICHFPLYAFSPGVCMYVAQRGRKQSDGELTRKQGQGPREVKGKFCGFGNAFVSNRERGCRVDALAARPVTRRLFYTGLEHANESGVDTKAPNRFVSTDSGAGRCSLLTGGREPRMAFSPSPRGPQQYQYKWEEEEDCPAPGCLARYVSPRSAAMSVRLAPWSRLQSLGARK